MGLIINGNNYSSSDSDYTSLKADVSELKTGKANTNLSNIPNEYDYVIESQLPNSSNGYLWYRLYKSGWVEQGGYNRASYVQSKTITFPIPMADTNYTLVGPGFVITNYGRQLCSCSTTGFTVSSDGQISGVNCWYVSGRSA